MTPSPQPGPTPAAGDEPMAPPLQALLQQREQLLAEDRIEELLPLLTPAPDGVEPSELAHLAFEAGRELLDRRRPEQALAAFSLALQHCPDLPELQCNLGIALQELDRTDEAFLALSLALLQQPELAEAWFAMSQTMSAAGELGEALQAAWRAEQLRPGWSDPLATAAVLLLKLGDWRQGWPLYEQRFFAGRPAVPLLQPAGPRCSPDTIPPAGELIVVAEQGLGDTLQFARFAAELRSAERSVTLCVQEPLRELLAEADLADRVLSPATAPASLSAPWLPLLSLPLALQLEPPRFAPRMPYLQAAPERVARWRPLLRPQQAEPHGEPHGDRRGERLLALHWQGNPQAEVKGLRGRSLPLASLAPLAALPGIRLVSLQKGAGSEQLADCAFRERFVAAQDAISESLDFRDVAAQLMLCDLLITSDSALAHLAGGLGRPTWLLLHHRSEWRWGCDARTTPWYPSMRLFRQRQPGDWAGVAAELAEAVQALT